ncbi:MAG: RsmB/NOP family class I SAM-dependent RNA methyltransferase [Nanoarchaeota archaeon]|nr:RsmB/NOP family class I SAM-dependent RNA methyltransferase [Nanoarchaeota archaeon]
MIFKDKFVEKYRKLIDFDNYKKSVLSKYVRKSVRVNTLHFSVGEVKTILERSGWNLERIPWCNEGFFIEHESGRRDIGNTREHREGKIFSQGAPSMIPAQLMNLTAGFNILDLCAAPGGKTHHIACLMKNKGRIVANDPSSFRRKILKINMERCGVENVKFDSQKGEDYETSEMFNSILVDAPCTGSGLIKGKIARSKKLLKEWNPKITDRYARLQMKILKNCSRYLKKNGRIVYVTCSMEPEEDEILLEKFLEENKNFKLVKPKRIKGHIIKSSLKDYIKIWPHYYDTHGLFIGVIEKTH